MTPQADDVVPFFVSSSSSFISSIRFDVRHLVALIASRKRSLPVCSSSSGWQQYYSRQFPVLRACMIDAMGRPSRTGPGRTERVRSTAGEEVDGADDDWTGAGLGGSSL